MNFYFRIFKEMCRNGEYLKMEGIFDDKILCTSTLSRTIEDLIDEEEYSVEELTKMVVTSFSAQLKDNVDKINDEVFRRFVENDGSVYQFIYLPVFSQLMENVETIENEVKKFN